jgi:hypothetical protein
MATTEPPGATSLASDVLELEPVLLWRVEAPQYKSKANFAPAARNLCAPFPNNFLYL